eukprot:41161-Pelagomonas_calceolata.AAC.4
MAPTKTVFACNHHQISVCAPSGERSAQSHAITLGQHLTCKPWDMGDNVHEAYAVDGTPADTVGWTQILKSVALHSKLAYCIGRWQCDTLG